MSKQPRSASVTWLAAWLQWLRGVGTVHPRLRTAAGVWGLAALTGAAILIGRHGWQTTDDALLAGILLAALGFTLLMGGRNQ